MSDIVAELRRRAKESRDRIVGTGDEAGPIFAATAVAYDEAADLLEADPLYKVAKDAVDALRAVNVWVSNVPPNGSPRTYYSWKGPDHLVRAVLAKIPKEETHPACDVKGPHGPHQVVLQYIDVGVGGKGIPEYSDCPGSSEPGVHEP